MVGEGGGRETVGGDQGREAGTKEDGGAGSTWGGMKEGGRKGAAAVGGGASLRSSVRVVVRRRGRLQERL